MSCTECNGQVVAGENGWKDCENGHRLYKGILSPEDGVLRRIKFATCGDCQSELVARIWGEGVDSEIKCTGCDQEVIIR